MTAQAQSISPKFAWPTNGHADIVGTGYLVNARNGARDSSALTSTSRMDVSPHRDGLLVTVGPSTTTGMPKTATSSAAMEDVGNFVSRQIVSADGRFLRYENAAEFKQHMDSMMAASRAPLSAATRALTGNVMSMETINTGAIRGWRQLVGLYISRSWVLGDQVVDTSVTDVPTMPGATMQSIQTIRYAGLTPCPSGSRANTCWRFELHTDANMIGFREAMMKHARAGFHGA